MKDFVRTGRPPRYPRGTHGNISEYERGCRCESCRSAYSAYQETHRRQRRLGEGDYTVSAEIARDHLLELQRKHVGMRAVAATTGMAFQRIQDIRNGRQARIRRSTEERILRVTEDARSDKSCVDAKETNRRVDQLRALGYTLTELGQRMGYKSATRSGLQFYGEARVTARTAMRVEKLYRQILREREQRMDRLLQLIRRKVAA